LLYRFKEENFKDYLKKAENCWKFTNDVQTKILCDVCDPEAQENMSLDKSDPKVYINLKAKSLFEASCIDMIKVNLNFIFPYLEVLEPLVRCNLDGKKTTKDRLRLRRSDRIWDDLSDGLSEEMVQYGLSFGEEINLNSEGDARFITFLFRNVKEFLEQNIGGESQKQLDAYISSKVKKDWSSFSMTGGNGMHNNMHNRRLKMLYEDRKSLTNFDELDKQDKVKFNDLLNAISKRILVMKKSKRSDYDVNSMIDSVKDKYKTKLQDGKVGDILEFNSHEEWDYQDVGAGGRMMIKDDRDVLDYSQELQRSPDIYADVKRKLKNIDDVAEKSTGTKLKLHTYDQYESAPKVTKAHDKPDTEFEQRLLEKEQKKEAEKKLKEKETERKDKEEFVQKMRNRQLFAQEGDSYGSLVNS
jgi:hypothetical protein